MRCNQICKWNSNDGCVKPYGVPCILENVPPIDKKATNADRIRSMSDQELEEFINHFNICDLRTKDECIMSYCGCCEVCVMDWLQQPVENTADAAAGAAEGGIGRECIRTVF